VGRRSKKNRLPAISQGIFADNVRRLRDASQKYAELENDTGKNRALAKDADTTLSQIQRVLNQQVSPGIDLVERIANAFGVRPQDMLTPYFGATATTIAVEAPNREPTRPARAAPRKAR
jgi:transcriptional regulator with XRE-family HTH domain